jgi:hypothetical protein
MIMKVVDPVVIIVPRRIMKVVDPVVTIVARMIKVVVDPAVTIVPQMIMWMFYVMKVVVKLRMEGRATSSPSLPLPLTLLLLCYHHSALLLQDKYFFVPKIDSDFSSFDQVMVVTIVDFDVCGGGLMMKIGCIVMAVVPNLDIPSLQ